MQALTLVASEFTKQQKKKYLNWSQLTVIGVINLITFQQIFRGEQKKKMNEDMVKTGDTVKSFYGNSWELC